MSILDFEKPYTDLNEKIQELKSLAKENDMKVLKDIEKLEKKASQVLEDIYSKLTPWQKVQIARHSNRPKSKDYIEAFFDDITYLEGDRLGAKDEAIMVGIAKFDDQTVMFIAQEKGNDIASRKRHNFGMPNPAGYRKVIRAIELANRWHLPVITFIDTPGAYPGKLAEEQGQAEAIAKSMAAFFKLEAPLISVIIGEGGSGGAIAIGVANEVLMLENAVCSIASPEACSSILWKSADKKDVAAAALKLTAKDLLDSKYVDAIVPEPLGGAHNFPQQTIENLRAALKKSLKHLIAMDSYLLLKAREEKFVQFGR